MAASMRCPLVTGPGPQVHGPADDGAAPVPHGGDLDAARRRHPAATGPWLDLSTGINPQPYPVPLLAAQAWTRLPEASDELELRWTAARCYGAADPAMIVSAPGTQALIQILPRLLPSSRPGDVAVLGPTYAEHARSWSDAGHTVREVATLAGAAAADVIVVVNPDNPTGRLLAADDLAHAARALHERGGLLVVDEAFIDVVEQTAVQPASLVPRLPPSTVVLRSFGKTYGLAGLRLGFAIAPEPIAAALRRMLGPWAVSGPALAIGRTALADAAWLSATQARFTVDVVRLDHLLNHAGFRLVGGTPLFRLVTHAHAGAIADILGAHAIHVRRFAHAPGWLRLGLPGSERDWQQLEHASIAARRAF